VKYNELVEYIKNIFKTDLNAAKEEFKEYWYAWETIIGNKHEGVLLEIDNGTYHVLCTDGIERAV
jgi:hypothetical protein